MTKPIAVAFLLLAAACSDNGDKNVVGAAGASGGTAGAGGSAGGVGPGELTISVEGLSDAAGRIVVVMVYPPGSNLGNAPSGVCLPVMSSPFSGSDKVKTRNAGMGGPCDLETTARVLDAGTQNIFAGLYVAGQMTAERCAQTTVEIKGNTIFTLPVLGACP